MDHSDGCDEYADCYSDGYSDGFYDEDSDASGSAPTGCRTRVDSSSPAPLHCTLTLRVLADASVQVQPMAIPTIIFYDVDSDEECFDCRYCSFPAGTGEDRSLHEDRCLSLLAKAHRLTFDPERRAGQRRRRGKASRTASANRPEGDPPSPGTFKKDGTPTVVLYPLGSPYYHPRMTDPRTTNRGAASPTLPNPPFPTPARRPDCPDSCAALASLARTSNRSALLGRPVAYFQNPPRKPTVHSQKVEFRADVDQGCL